MNVLFVDNDFSRFKTFLSGLGDGHTQHTIDYAPTNESAIAYLSRFAYDYLFLDYDGEFEEGKLWNFRPVYDFLFNHANLFRECRLICHSQNDILSHQMSYLLGHKRLNLELLPHAFHKARLKGNDIEILDKFDMDTGL